MNLRRALLQLPWRETLGDSQVCGNVFLLCCRCLADAPRTDDQWFLAENRYDRKWRRSQLRKAMWKDRLGRRRLSSKQGYGTPRFTQVESSSQVSETGNDAKVRPLPLCPFLSRPPPPARFLSSPFRPPSDSRNPAAASGRKKSTAQVRRRGRG